MGGLLAAGNARAQAPPFFSSTFMKLHIVPARTGMTWVKLGIRTFWKQPMALAALFFMTEAALSDFRRSQGWAAGADLKYATPEQGASIGKDTTEIEPVIALVFGQAGLIAGATLSGTKYTRIIP